MVDRLVCAIIATCGGAVFLGSMFGTVVAICWLVMGIGAAIWGEIERRG